MSKRGLGRLEALARMQSTELWVVEAAAMVEGLGNREPGRPLRPIDPEKEALQRQTWEPQAKLQVLEQTERILQRLEPPDRKA